MMREIIKNIVSKLGIVRLYRMIMGWYYNIASEKFTCSVGDILLCRDHIQANQFLLTSRLLDVEAYLNGTDKSFPYQNAISYKAYGKAHNEELGNRRFQELIESYRKEGYHADSFVTCDRNMNLMDGNHRMGVHVYEGLQTINVRRVRRTIPFQYGIDGYYECGLSSELIARVCERYASIQKWLISEGMTFVACIKGEYKDVLSEDLGGLCKVLQTLKATKFNATIVLFSMSEPRYEVKNGTLFSLRAEEIERIMRKRSGGNTEIIVSKNCMEGQGLYKAYIPQTISQ